MLEQGSQSLSPAFWQRLKGRGGKKLYSREKGGLRYVLIGGWWPGEAGGRLTRSGAAYVMVRGMYWLLLFGPKLKAGSKIREARSYESNLAILG